LTRWKRLKSKVRKAYNRKKLGIHHMEKKIRNTSHGRKIRNTSHGGTATTVQKATCSQESGTRDILKIITKQGDKC
jgi:hypothetical protein